MSVSLINSTLLGNATMDTDGAFEVRKQIFFAGGISDTSVDVLAHPSYPAHRSVLYEDPSFTLRSSTLTRVGDTAQTTWLCEAIYRTQSGKSGNTRGKKPWELAIQEPSITWDAREVPFELAYNDDNDLVIPVVNRANQPIQATTTERSKVISFYYYKQARPSIYRTPVTNTAKLTILDEPEIDAGDALLMPLTFQYMTTYDQSSSSKSYNYYKIDVEIHVSKRGWKRKFLNVGTRAKFTVGGNSYYSGIYTWHQNNVGVQVYGSRLDGLAAYTAWNRLNPADNTFDKWSMEQVTEPLPLTDTGALDRDAIYNPQANPYKVLSAREFKRVDFSFLGLPK